MTNPEKLEKVVSGLWHRRTMLIACGSFSIALFMLAYISVEIPANPVTGSLPALQDDDQKFIAWAKSASKALNYDIEGSLNAIANYDLKTMKIYGGLLREESRMYMYEQNRFIVSAPLKPAVEEFQKALDSYQMAGNYMVLAAENADVEALNLANNYTLEGNIHLTKANLKLPASSQ